MDFLSRIPDSKAQDSRFHNNADSLTWRESPPQSLIFYLMVYSLFTCFALKIRDTSGTGCKGLL